MRTQGGEAIIGRDHPAEVLGAEIARAADSHGGLVLITGEAGIGKTTLAGAAAEEARRRGALVLSGSCWSSDGAPGFWPWVQVVRGLRRAATAGEWAAAEATGGSGLGVLLGEAPATAPDTAGPGPDPAEAFRVFDAVTSALVAVAQDRPVVVVLDDLHWADPASLRLLEFAAQHTWFERLLLVGTYRDVEVEPAEHPLAPLLLQLVAKATTVTLTGLGPDEVGALIARTTGRQPDPELVAEVHRRTGGNPSSWSRRRGCGTPTARWPRSPPASATPWAAAWPSSPGRWPSCWAWRPCSARSSTPGAGRLRGGGAGPAGRAARPGGRRPAGGGRRSRPVRVRPRPGPRDPRRRARRAGAAPPARRRRPGRRPGPGAGRAAGPGRPGPPRLPGRGRARPRPAARDAGARLATEEAAGHLGRALEVVEDPARRARIALKLGQALYFAGGREEAERLFEEAAALARRLDTPELLARVALTVNRYQAVGEAATPSADELLCEAHRRLVGGGDGAPGHDQLVRELVAATELLARQGGDDKALTFSLWVRHDATWGPGRAREREALTAEMVEVARRSGDRQSEMFAASLRWVALVEQGDPRYLDQVAALIALGGRLDVPRDRMMLAIDRSVIATLQGRLRRRRRPAGRGGQPRRPRPPGPRLDAPAPRVVPGDAPGPPGRGRPAGRRAGTGRPPVRRSAVGHHRGRGGRRRAGPAPPGRGRSGRHGLPAGGGRAVAAPPGPGGGPRRRPAALRPGPGDAGPAPRRMGGVAVRLRHRRAGGPLARRRRRRPGALGRRGRRLRRGPGGRRPAPGPAVVGQGRCRAGRRPGRASRGRRRQGAIRPGQRVPARRPVWRLGYDGRVVHLPDAKGLADLHLLLGRPGVDVPAVELLDPAAGPELVAARRLGGDPVLDEQAKDSYRRRLAELDEAIDQAAGRGDDGRAAALDLERAALLEQLRAAAGLAGRTRRLGDEAERARKTVGARIRHTLRRLDRRHPELAAHLRGAVSTGATCRYAPAEPVAWRL
jgi:AAA ATPase domain